MPEKDYQPRYWLNLFTEETWLEAAHRDFSISGFTERRWNMVRRMRSGDILICYLTKISAYVGLLRITGDPYQDTSLIWKSQVFPSRVRVEPILTLKPDAGVPVRSLSDRLSYFQNLPHPQSNAWTGYFRGSPAEITSGDARVIVEALEQAASASERHLDTANIPILRERPKRRKKGTRDAPASEVKSPDESITSATSVRGMIRPDQALRRRLVETAKTGEDGTPFEEALTEAFAFLGFRTERRSGSGDTDVLAVAQLGEEAYRIVIDAKASRHGRVGNAQIDWYALERHKAKHDADHILVVAPGFSGGELTRDAERTGAALLSAQDLAEIIALHVQAPFTLPQLRDLFRYPGKPDLPATRMREHAYETNRLQRLLPDIVDAITEAYQYELFDPVNADSLLLPLAQRRKGRAYSREEITAALDLLCEPQIAVLRRVGEGRYTLQMPKATLTRRLHSLVRIFDGEGPDSEVQSFSTRSVSP